MARVDHFKAIKSGLQKQSTMEKIKKQVEKDTAMQKQEEKDVKPIIKPRNRIEPGTVIDLEDCINTKFDDAKEMYRKTVDNSELLKIGQIVGAEIANKKREEDAFEQFESKHHLDLSYKYDIEKMLKNDDSDTSALLKLASAVTAEEEATQKILSTKQQC